MMNPKQCGGGILYEILWTQVAARLMQSLNIEIPLEANMPVIAPTLAAAHLLLMMLVILSTALILTKNNRVVKRR